MASLFQILFYFFIKTALIFFLLTKSYSFYGFFQKKFWKLLRCAPMHELQHFCSQAFLILVDLKLNEFACNFHVFCSFILQYITVCEDKMCFIV